MSTYPLVSDAPTPPRFAQKREYFRYICYMILYLGCFQQCSEDIAVGAKACVALTRICAEVTVPRPEMLCQGFCMDLPA